MSRECSALQCRRSLAVIGIDCFVLLRFRRRTYVDAPWIELPAMAREMMKLHEGGDADPLARHAIDEEAPFYWRALMQRNDVHLAVTNWIEQAGKHGCHSGLTIPVHGPAGACDVFHLSCRKSAGTSDRAALLTGSGIAFVASTRLRDIDALNVQLRAKGPALSLRELEVLRWCKEGKSYAEIGMIVGISSKTVEFHIANAMRKLGVNHKITAIIAAVKQGWLDL